LTWRAPGREGGREVEDIEAATAQTPVEAVKVKVSIWREG
jgi:hypothetical protein